MDKYTISQLLRILAKGIIGGALVGFLTGGYVIVLSAGYVVRRDDFTLPIGFEDAQWRYASTVLLAFTVVFAAFGPFIAAADFGSWIRHCVYGAVAGMMLIVAGTLLVAYQRNEQPFNQQSGSSGTCIRFARELGIPVGALIGAAVGLAYGRYVQRSGIRAV